jgi:hypothetical protein
MVYKKIQNNKGDYKDNQEVRYDVLEAHEAWTPEGLNMGWDEFENKEAALASYGLTYDPLPIEEPMVY